MIEQQGVFSRRSRQQGLKRKTKIEFANGAVHD
jgi:hypothetical protein